MALYAKIHSLFFIRDTDFGLTLNGSYFLPSKTKMSLLFLKMLLRISSILMQGNFFYKYGYNTNQDKAIGHVVI